jgi:hypothetical protein
MCNQLLDARAKAQSDAAMSGTGPMPQLSGRSEHLSALCKGYVRPKW